jgi:hypothetical protein
LLDVLLLNIWVDLTFHGLVVVVIRPARLIAPLLDVFPMVLSARATFLTFLCNVWASLSKRLLP